MAKQKNSMYVVRHYDECVDPHRSKVNGNLCPTPLDDESRGSWTLFIVQTLSEDRCASIGADSHEVCSSHRVVERLKTGALARRHGRNISSRRSQLLRQLNAEC
jgi:hypothetical protein